MNDLTGFRIKLCIYIAYGWYCWIWGLCIAFFIFIDMCSWMWCFAFIIVGPKWNEWHIRPLFLSLGSVVLHLVIVNPSPIPTLCQSILKNVLNPNNLLMLLKSCLNKLCNICTISSSLLLYLGGLHFGVGRQDLVQLVFLRPMILWEMVLGFSLFWINRL